MPKYSTQILEEELKNKVAADFFHEYDTTKIVGKIDFAVAVRNAMPSLFDEPQFLLWAEAKRGVKQDIKASLVQLVLTIGRARTFDRHLPPIFLGAFDAEKIAFLPYHMVNETFYQNDFNWNVPPSDHETREFKLLYRQIDNTLQRRTLLFLYDRDEKELRQFIRQNMQIGKQGITRIRITKNNFTAIYQKWRADVMPCINANWEAAKKNGIIDADFFLADILSTNDNASIKDKLFVLLSGDHYIFAREKDDFGFMNSKTAEFTDGGTAHAQFWARYHRPPRREWWGYMVDRRDLLVPQDVRERKGSYFTPACWVELSQQYLADYLGENWQEEYYIWDCCAGTGNLLVGLTNKYNIYASTLDRADVDVMRDRIHNGANLLENHVFQFDFLNDDLQGEKVPESLRRILADPEERKKLVIYINPPYKEAPQVGTQGQKDVQATMINERYANILGQGNRELFAQFLTRIYHEIPNSILGEFSTLKILQGPHFVDFRRFFRAKLGRFFVVPANTFDNVKGQFPIGFMVWDTNINEPFTEAIADVYDSKGNMIDTKSFQAYDHSHYMNEWAKAYRGNNKEEAIGKFPFKGNDFQNQNMVQIVHPNMDYNTAAGQFYITKENVIVAAIYFAARKTVPATWLNDRDQFLYPNESWKDDAEFQADCLAYTLFNNNIQSQFGTNHWIPFTEEEVGAKERFDSHFMSDFIKGKTKQEAAPQADLFGQTEISCTLNGTKPIEFSPEARAVIDAGRELWQYYHQQPAANPNASFYDIRRHFQGVKVTDKGKEMMNTESQDEHYTQLTNNLRQSLKALAKKIEPKVYDYGFLRR